MKLIKTKAKDTYIEMEAKTLKDVNLDFIVGLELMHQLYVSFRKFITKKEFNDFKLWGHIRKHSVLAQQLVLQLYEHTRYVKQTYDGSCVEFYGYKDELLFRLHFPCKENKEIVGRFLGRLKNPCESGTSVKSRNQCILYDLMLAPDSNTWYYPYEEYHPVSFEKKYKWWDEDVASELLNDLEHEYHQYVWNRFNLITGFARAKETPPYTLWKHIQPCQILSYQLLKLLADKTAMLEQTYDKEGARFLDKDGLLLFETECEDIDQLYKVLKNAKKVF